MFKIIDLFGNVYDAYGTFLDQDNEIQFILYDKEGKFYTTNKAQGYYRLYNENNIQEEPVREFANELKKYISRIKLKELQQIDTMIDVIAERIINRAKSYEN